MSAITVRREVVAAALAAVAAAVTIGGAFEGVAPRVVGVTAVLAGVGVADRAARWTSPLLSVPVVAAVVAGAGITAGLLADPAAVGSLADQVRQAAAEGDLSRPPVEFTPGWHAIVAWAGAAVGYAAGWVGAESRRPALAVVVPLPFAAVGAISVPEAQQVGTGVAVLGLLGLAFTVLATGDELGTGADTAFEVRRLVRAVPVVAVLCLAVAGASRVDVLFPDPAIDPASEPQVPDVAPLGDSPDRVLFEVAGGFTGPFRMGVLDTYDDTDGTWRLPPFSQAGVEPIRSDGVIEPASDGGLRVEFTARSLGGAVLPTVANPVAIAAPRLPAPVSIERRTGAVRLDSGQLPGGLDYTLVARAVPNEGALRAASTEVDREVAPFTELPGPPPAAENLLGEAVAASVNRWDRFLFLRAAVLDRVVVSGTGQPGPVPPARVQEILTGLEANPFEVAALQVMLARWAGVPARLGYGYDCAGGACTELPGGRLAVGPQAGSVFPEVYFSGFGWLPVTGTPAQARPGLGGDGSDQRVDPLVVPAGDLQVELFVPVTPDRGGELWPVVLRVVGAVLAALLLLAGAAVAIRLARAVRARVVARRAARDAGARARVAHAYSEWRELAAAYGVGTVDEPPLAFLDRVEADPDHTELAWLVSRALWGDLSDRVTDQDAALAESLSRSLRRRLAAGQPLTVRAAAALRNPGRPAGGGG